MKFTCFPIGQFGLILTFSVLTTACNQEEFFKAEEFLVGNDAYCFQEGPDANACRALGDRCRVAYLEAADETQEPEFLMCIGNPDWNEDGSSTGGSSSGDGSSDGSTTGGTTGDSSGDGSSDGSTTGGTTGDSSGNGSSDGSTTGGSTGGTSGDGSSDGSTVGGTSGGVDGPIDAPNDLPPSIEDTVKAKCENLDPKYIWEKVEKDKKGKTTKTKKVKVCHHSARGHHNIVIACPALKAHVKHHDDYIGVCAE